MSLRARAPIFAILALLIGALVGLQLSGPEPGLLYLAPALALLMALAFGRYPGEALLEAIERRRERGRRDRQLKPTRRAFPLRSFPRGGVLIAMALAERGPPG